MSYKAYPVDAIREAPGGMLTDTWKRGRVRLKAGEDGSVTLLEAPPKAQTVHTFWFAWAAFHPTTEIAGTAAVGDDAGAEQPPRRGGDSQSDR